MSNVFILSAGLELHYSDNQLNHASALQAG